MSLSLRDLSKGLAAPKLEPIEDDHIEGDASNSTWKWAALAGAAVAATAVVGYAIAKSVGGKPAEKPKKTLKKKKAKKAAASPSPAPGRAAVVAEEGEVSIAVVENNEVAPVVLSNNASNLKSEKVVSVSASDLATLIAEANAALDNLSGSNIIEGIKGENFTSLFELLCTIDPSEFSATLRLEAAQWLLKYTTTELVVSMQTSDLPQEVIVQKSQSSLEFIWSFIDFDGSLFENPIEFEQFLLAKLDVSQRRNDLVGLAQTYEEASRVDSKELKMASFHVSPILGKWDDFLKLGITLEKAQPGMLKQLHSICAQQVQFPDYETLFQLVSFSRQNLPEVNIDELQKIPRTFSITKASLRFVDAHGENDAMAEQIRQSLAGQTAWQDIDLDNTSPVIIRNGALIQCTGFSPMPTSLIGVYKDGDFNLAGYAEQEAPGVGVMRYNEELRLARSQNKNIWTGKSEVTQDFVPLGASPSDQVSDMNVTMTFEVRLEIEESAL